MKFEDEIQQQIEGGKHPQNDDEAAYLRVFNALKKAPSELPVSGLADRVLLRLEKRSVSKRSWIELILPVLGGVMLLVGLVVTIVLTKFKLNFGFLSAMRDYAGLIVFGVCFILLLNFIDRLVVRKKILDSRI